MLQQWESVSKQLAVSERLLADLSEKPTHPYANSETIRKQVERLTRREADLRHHVMRFFPERNPHIDQYAALVEAHWHLPPMVVKDAWPDKAIFHRFNSGQCPPKTPLGDHRVSFPNQPDE
ncbi:hypothetical protein BGX27_005899 [Mortierella sp. AM989]|nr:hypothetical protein BGX27_005899 [Mortierella sp. AM989]